VIYAYLFVLANLTSSDIDVGLFSSRGAETSRPVRLTQPGLLSFLHLTVCSTTLGPGSHEPASQKAASEPKSYAQEQDIPWFGGTSELRNARPRAR
jgi:hypothetical protein